MIYSTRCGSSSHWPYSSMNTVFKSLLLILLLVTAGCMRHKTHDPKIKASLAFGDDADFDVQKSGGRILRNQALMIENIRGWSVPATQTFSFFTVLSDTISRNSLRDFSFEILDEEGNQICEASQVPNLSPKCRFKANADSEIQWIEHIGYDYFKSLAEPVFIVRKIRGLGSRRGTRTIVLQINPWASDRPGLSEVEQRTFNLSESESSLLVNRTYKASEHLRVMNETTDSSELVVMNVTPQVYPDTEPLLIGRYDDELASIRDQYQLENFFFTRYDREEFIKRRRENDPTLPENLDFVSEITRGQNTFYVYRLPDETYPENLDGIKLDFVLKMNMGYRYSTLNGEKKTVEISVGRFRVHAHLLLEPTTGVQPVLLTAGLQPQIQNIKRDNVLQFNYKAIIPFYPSSGIIKLALRIYPQGIGQGLKPVDRLFTVGPYNRLIGRTGDLIEDEVSYNDNFKFEDYIKSALNGNEAYNLGYVDRARDFQFNTMTVRFSTVEAGETAAQRTVIFRVNTPVIDELTGIAPAGDNVAFEVVSVHTDYNNPSDTSKWKVVTLTNPSNNNDPSRVRNGEFIWYDKITHKYYQKEELVERYVFITRWKNGSNLAQDIRTWINTHKDLTNEDLPSHIQKLKIFLNPWDEKFGTFGLDARIASESFLQNVRGRDKIEPRFFIGDFGYETLRFRYKIDKDMHLNVKKTVLLNVKPLVLRYSSILEGINSVYNLRDGIYLMKTAIQKDYLDPSARNEKDIFAIPFEIEGEETSLLTQPYDRADEDLAAIPGIDIQAPNGDSSVLYGGREVENTYAGGVLNQNAHGIPYGDPRRKRAMSMVKKLVRVNAGRVITPVEFSVDDLRLMRIRQQFFVQLEPINQVRLQMVNLVKERFEQIFQISLGDESPILSRMTLEEQERLKYLMAQVLDAVAAAVSDDVYVSKIEDLENIVDDPNVLAAINAFESANFRNQNLDMRLKDILREIKAENDAAIASQESGVLDDQAVQRRIEEVEAENLRRREQHDLQLQAINELREESQKVQDNIRILERQCRQLNPVQVYYDESQKSVSESEAIDPVTKALIPFDTGIYPDNYSDDVSKFQPFQNGGEQFLESLVNQTTLSDILKNDFTQTPAFGAVSNLDMLVDKKSGIKGRTFVGPMTFLYNTNRGSLRPTDNLDEAYCETDDCNSLNTSIDSQYGEIQNFGYEKSPYHGSIAHFQGITFNDKETVDPRTGLVTVTPGLETLYNNLMAEKQARKRVDTLLTRYLDHYDMSYVSMNDKPIDRLVCTHDISSDACFKEDTLATVKLNDFLSEYSKTVNDIVNINYQTSPEVIFGFQNLETSERTGNTQYNDAYVRDYAAALPWGFISARHQVGLDRCGLDSTNSDLQVICSEDNESRRLGGLLGRSYQKEAMYLEPTKQELVDIIRYPFQGREMVSAEAAQFSTSVQLKMCDLLVYGELGRKAKLTVTNEGDRLRLRKELFELARRCKIDVNNGLKPVVIERKFRIFETGRYYFLGGKSMNVNASRDVKLSTGLRVSRNFGFRPLRIITGIIEKGRSFISVAMGLFMGSFDFSYSIQRDRTFNEGTAITSGTYLVMQNAEFEVELTSYEQCLSVRWHPDYAAKYSRHVSFVTDRDSEFYNPLAENYIRALYLCSGITEQTPIAVNEKYYYFTQHFTEGDMLDPADIHNHPWLLSLRGVREFNTFMLSLQEFEPQADGTYVPDKVKGEELIGYFDFIGNDLENIRRRMNGDVNTTDHYSTTLRQEWPIHQMVTTYKEVMPTFPGTYTQLNSEDYYDRTWPWDTGVPGQVMENSNICE